MPKHLPTSAHNYIKKIEALGFTHPSGTMVDVVVQHDSWCDKLHGRGFCNCDPDVYQKSSPYLTN